MTQIIPFRSGINTCYIVKDKGAVLIDAATPGQGHSFSKLLSDSGIRPEEIQLIILTHGDFDHCGSAKEIQELTGAKIVLHEKDRKNLEESIFHWPEGTTAWGRISHTLFMPLVKKLIGKIPATKVDIVMDDNDLSLKEYGDIPMDQSLWYWSREMLLLDALPITDLHLYLGQNYLSMQRIWSC